LDGARTIAAVATIAARTDNTAPFRTAATDNTDPINTAATSASAGDIAVAPIDAAAPHRIFTLEDMAAMIVANTVGITSLRELMKENVDTVKQLTQTGHGQAAYSDRDQHVHTGGQAVHRGQGSSGNRGTILPPGFERKHIIC